MSDDVLHSLGNDARKGTVIVGNSANGDRARFNCHVVDDIDAGLALLPALGSAELLVKRGDYTPVAAIDVPVDDITITFEDGVRIVRPDADHAFTLNGRRQVRFKGGAVIDGATKAGAFDLINIVDSSEVYLNDLYFTDNSNGAGVYIEGDDEAVCVEIQIVGCEFLGCERGVYANNVGTSVAALMRVRIVRCNFETTQSEAIWFAGVGYSSIESVYSYNCGQTDNTSGILIQGTAEPVLCVFVIVRNVWVVTAGADGITLEDSASCIITDSVFEDADTNGIHLLNADNCNLSGNVSTNNTSDGVNIDANSDRTVVVGNQLLGNGANPLTNNGTNTDAGHNIVA